MKKRRVVVTGACGYIFGRLIDAFRERYDLVLLDVRNTNAEGKVIEGVNIVDLLDLDRNKYRHYFKDADALVHGGFKEGRTRRFVDGGTPEARSDKFQSEMQNVQMTFNVFQAAVEENVRRAVVCSSIRVVESYDTFVLDGRVNFVDEQVMPRSDHYYGWTKQVVEDVGYVFASGGENGGRRLEQVHIRIGGPRETDIDNCNGDLKKMRRALSAYFSQRDQIQLFSRAIEAENIADEFGVPFLIVYGISDNDYKFWSLHNARQVLGYQPQDNSSIKFADKVARLTAQAQQIQYS
ncbi:MAG: NAD(P)-dependent oxidoreductase [Chloroflexi bacterium]|nr:NAD(P)-dependent oxidoreductase [Chloroflexota bacterium]